MVRCQYYVMMNNLHMYREDENNADSRLARDE